MRDFTQLMMTLERAIHRRQAEEALGQFRLAASAADIVWVDLMRSEAWGRRRATGVPPGRLRLWACELSGYPPWMVEACYQQVRDLADTLALLIPEGPGSDLPLHQVMERYVEPLAFWDEPFQLGLIRDFWLSLDRPQARLFGKLVNGTLRLRLPPE